MHYPDLNASIACRYLELLGISSTHCALDDLRNLVSAHLIRIPFENISMLYRFSQFGLTATPPIDMFLDGVEQHHFGGMCFSSNIHFHSLLTTLGFDARLCGADMQSVNAHMVIIVTLDQHEYLVDVGYGAPFYEPMRRDLDSDLLIGHTHAEYRLKTQDKSGRSRMEFYQNGMLRHSFLVNPQPLTAADFQQTIEAVFDPAATFRKILMLARFWPERLRVVHNFTVIDAVGDQTSFTKIANRDALIQLIQESFGIPSYIVGNAFDCVTNLASASA